MTFTSKAIKEIRKFHLKTQADFGKSIDITAGYVSQLESGSADPSHDLVKKICKTYDIQEPWFLEGKGEPFADDEKSRQLLIQMRRPATQKALIAASAAFAPLMPLVSVGLALGVGADYVLQKMLDAYDVKTFGELADRLNVNRSTLNRWQKSNKIPLKYIEFAADNTNHREEFFTTNDKTIDDLIDLIVDFAEDQSRLFKNVEINTDIIRNNFLKLLEDKYSINLKNKSTDNYEL